ncbi:MAG: hypothetical protein H6822_16555 [Planctomycetaceae bacterium]|nr:hypothetical protein [Planctomycetales bacterium]MCB9923794.1 hypothetical protein [Planctomycetaceae bacterium]
MLGWLRLFARSRVERTLLLDPDEFEAMLKRERSRADRAGSVFSVLTLSVSPTQLQPADLQSIAETFRKRRRATDLTGRTPDGRIGIVLPDTTREQAEVLAASLSETLSDKGISFSHSISLYPETTR